MSSETVPSVKDISAALKEHAEAFATDVIGEAPRYRTGSQLRYYANHSLVVYTSGPYQGRFKWFADEDARGDMLDLFVFQRGGSPGDAIRYAKDFLGRTSGNGTIPPAAPPSRAQLDAAAAEEDRERLEKARDIWNAASPTEGREAGRAYLAGRGITADLPDTTLRYRTLDREALRKLGLRGKDLPDVPAHALVFAARDGDGALKAVQQVFIANGTRLKLADGSKLAKRTNGLLAGTGVWFGDPNAADTAILAEGPETGLSAFEATGLPTCVTLSSSNFTKVHVPDQVRRLIIAADMEPTGRGLAAAIMAAQTHTNDHGRPCGIAVPPLRDGDFNDVHNDEGAAAVKRLFDKAYFAPERERDGTVLVTADSRAAFHAWVKTGIEVKPKVPPRREDGTFRPLNLLNAAEPQHNRVLIIETPGIEVSKDPLAKSRPDVEIHTIHSDSREFRKVARNSAALVRCINAPDLYLPSGAGEDGPVFFALRRQDADALEAAGVRAAGIRSSAIDRLDFSFMKGRQAVIAPIGEGTKWDDRLESALKATGATCDRLTWQLFRGDAQDRPALLRTRIPETFGARDAVSEGWTGQALADLVTISRANRAQIARARAARQTPRSGRTASDAAR